MITSFFIYIFDIILLCYFIKNLLIGLLTKPEHPLSYKIVDKTLSIISICIYIVIFYILLNYQRIIYRDRVIDLKVFGGAINNAYNLSNIPLIFKIIFVITIVLLISTLCLFVCYTHKILSNEIYKLFIFMNYRSFLVTGAYSLNGYYREQAEKEKSTFYPYNDSLTEKINKLFYKLQTISNNTLLYYLLERLLEDFFLFLQDMEKVQTENYIRRIPTHPIYVKIFKMLFKRQTFIKRWDITIFDFIFKLSPIIIILTECIVNNFVLHYIFIYMIFYIPIILMHRITKCLGYHDPHMGDLIWIMCYKQEDCIYLATKNQHITFMYFIKNGLKIPLELDGPLDRVFISQTLNLLHISPLRYELTDIKHEIYTNAFGHTAHKKENGKFYVVTDYDLEDGESFIKYGEELVVLLDKNLKMNL